MDLKRSSALRGVVFVLAAAVMAGGCASSVTRWMVNLRTSQGTAALARSNLAEAQKEYGLALKLDPHDASARSGLADVLYLQAKADFTNSKLDQAEVEIEGARAIEPSDADAQALATQIEQARIRREIVLANYPLYESVGTTLGDSLKTLTASQKEVAKQIKSFANDFDTAHLTKAIVTSYYLEEEAHRMAQRLIAYRALVSTGTSTAHAPTQEETPNLLPVP
jgi:tetratricopeptide (TPR) repeat protein